MNKSIVAAAIGLFGLCAYASLAAGYSAPAYQAEYNRTSSLGSSTYKMCSDGKGRMRIDSQTPGSGMKSVTIMDYPKKQNVILIEQSKMAMVMPIRALLVVE